MTGNSILATDSQADHLKSLMPYFFDMSVENKTQSEIIKPLRYVLE